MRIGRFVSSDPDADKVVDDDESVVDAVVVVVVLSSEGAAGDVDDSDGSDMVIVWLWLCRGGGEDESERTLRIAPLLFDQLFSHSFVRLVVCARASVSGRPRGPRVLYLPKPPSIYRERGSCFSSECGRCRRFTG